MCLLPLAITIRPVFQGGHVLLKMRWGKMIRKSGWLVVAVAAVALAGCKEKVGGEAGKATAAATGEKVEFVMHVMSQCPFGVQVENGFAPVLKKMGDHIDFKIEFIGDEPTPGQFTAMHGDSEVKGNILHLCTIKHEPVKFMDLILCMNKDMRQIPNNLTPAPPRRRSTPPRSRRAPRATRARHCCPPRTSARRR